MPKLRSPALFFEAKSCFRDELDTLLSEHSKALSELQEIREWIKKTRKTAKKIFEEGQRVQVKADLCELTIYKTEVKDRLKKIKKRVIEIQKQKVALFAQARQAESEERTNRGRSSSPSLSSENPSRDKKPVPTTTRVQFFCWNCPVCHANFLSEKTKLRHIQAAHGMEAVSQAIAEQRKSPEKKKIAITTHSAHTGALDATPRVSTVDAPYFKGACRVCGKNHPMPGDDICFHCQSE